MDRVRRLFSNLQCCKSGTEADSLKSRNDKYLIHVVDSTEEDYGLKALASPRGGAGGAFVGSGQNPLVRSRSCPEISEHNYDGDGSPAHSGDGKWRPSPPHHHSSSRGGGMRPHVGGGQQLEASHPASRDNQTSQEKSKQLQQQQQQEYHNQRRRRQKRPQQYEYQYHYQYQRRSADESQRFRGPGDGGGGGAFFGGGSGGGFGGRVEFLHAAGDYCVNLPDRVVSSAPGGVGRS